MVSKNQRKQILQLKQKKYRLATGLFVAEGEKVVEELLSASWTCVSLFSFAPHFHPQSELLTVSEMKGITHFKSPSPVLGVFKLPLPKKIVKEIKIPIQGGLDPKILLTDQSTLKQQVEKYLSIFKDHPYIFNLGHGILPETKIEMVENLINIVRNFK